MYFRRTPRIPGQTHRRGLTVCLVRNREGIGLEKSAIYPTPFWVNHLGHTSANPREIITHSSAGLSLAMTVMKNEKKSVGPLLKRMQSFHQSWFMEAKAD